MIANFFKITVIFINQILLVPAYLIYLGTELYGDWIVISAITSFFTMSDVGISSVSQNLFSIQYNRGEFKQCQITLINNLIFTIGILFIGLLIFALFGTQLNLPKLLNLKILTQQETCLIGILFILQILLIMGGNVFDSVYNAAHFAHKVIYLNNLAKLANGLIILICLIYKLNIVKLVLLSIIPFLILDIYKIIGSEKIFKIEYSLKYVNIKYLKSIFRPAIGFMFFPAGNAILFQGLTLLVNSFLGSVSVILFNTTRTMTNFVRSLVQAISSGIKPEFSIAYALGEKIKMISLIKKSLKLSIAFAVIAILALIVGGDIIFSIWTKDKIKYDSFLTLILCLSLIVNTIWESTCIALTSTNNHAKFSLIYVLTTILVVVVLYFILSFHESLYIAASSMIMVDIIMAFSSLIMVIKLMKS